MTPLRPNHQRMKVAEALLFASCMWSGICILVSVIAFVSLDLGATFFEGMTPFLYDGASLFLQGASVWLDLVVAIAFITWVFRAITNLSRRIKGMRYAGLVAVIGWILPFLGLVMPFFAVWFMFRKTDQAMREMNPEYQRAYKGSQIVVWGIFVFLGGLTLYVFPDFSEWMETEVFSTEALAMILLHAIGLIGAWLGIALIRKYHRIETAFLEADLLIHSSPQPPSEIVEHLIVEGSFEVFRVDFGQEKPLFPED